MPVKFSKKFGKNYERADAKIKSAFNSRLKLFLQDQFHPLLDNHSLTGKLKDFRSINITGDWRAIFSISSDTEKNQIIIFEMLGTHSQLYK